MNGKTTRKTARAISRRKQLETARACELARELIDDPIRIVALSERKGVEGPLALPWAPWPVRRGGWLIYGSAIRIAAKP